jgi:hypothetical protein
MLCYRIASALLIAGLCAAQSQTVPLWTGRAPGALGDAPEDRPELTIFTAPTNNRVLTGIIVCPGGGYHTLSFAKEGTDVATWLNQFGISAFVLR